MLHRHLVRVTVLTFLMMVLGAGGAAASAAQLVDANAFQSQLGFFPIEAQYVRGAFTYTHSLPEAMVLESAYLDLSFIGDLTDAQGSFWFFDWDFTEFAGVSIGSAEPWNNPPRNRLGRYFQGQSFQGWNAWGPGFRSSLDWTPIGEVDNSDYEVSLSEDSLSWLNANRSISVTLWVWNSLGTGDAFLQKSELWGTPQAAPVPIPGTLALLAPAVLGLIGLRRRR